MEINEAIKGTSCRDANAAKTASDVIVANCKTIQTKLKIRTEMKKK